MNPTFTFTILGNHEDPKGNPVGYVRTTQASKWNPSSRRYYEWKQYVVWNALEGLKRLKRTLKKVKASQTAIMKGKLLDIGKKKAYLHTKIFYASGSGPDPDNVQKGIADALFLNDKRVAGSYDFEVSKEKQGRVEVTVEILEDSG